MFSLHKMTAEIGNGAFGVVYRRNGLAVKEFQEHIALVQEAAMLTYLQDCHHIVKICHLDLSNLQLSMELYEMSLRRWIQTARDPGKVRQILCEILQGLIELHDRGLVHGDLKPNNILLNREPWKVVLGDCGFVTAAHCAKVSKTAPGYRDPYPEPENTHDIYSFGMCVFELACDRERKLQDPFYHELIERCCDKVKERRPTARELYRLLSGKVEPSRWRPVSLRSFKVNNPTYHGLTELVRKLQESDGERYKRARKLCVGLTLFLREKRIDRREYDTYLLVGLLLSSAIFGGRKMRTSYIERKHSLDKEAINERLVVLMSYAPLMACLMAPK